jgi:hypothetical protein
MQVSPAKRILVILMSVLVAGAIGAGMYLGTRKAEGGVPPRQLPSDTWRRADPSQPGLVNVGQMSGVVSFEGLVAVGRDGPDRAGIWTSANGTIWNRAVLRPSGGPQTRDAIEGIARDGTYLVAVGRQVKDEISRGVTWVSSDGSRWQGPATIEGQGALHALEKTRLGLIAVGERGTYNTADAAVLLSQDHGNTWRRVTSPAFGGPGRQVIFAVAATPEGLIAVGNDGEDGATWTSSDGIEWSKDPPGLSTALRGEGDQILFAVAVASGTVVVVGVDDSSPAIWIRHSRQPWKPVLLAPGHNLVGAIYDLAVKGPELIAVGFIVDQSGDPNAAVLTSADMTHWTINQGESFRGQGTQLIQGVVATEDRLIAVGADHGAGPTPAVWIGGP